MLAFNERALLADEMGLGKTIQAIAACALLHRMGKAARVLVVTPASLKTEWEEQIQHFSGLSYRPVFGPHRERLRASRDTASPSERRDVHGRAIFDLSLAVGSASTFVLFTIVAGCSTDKPTAKNSAWARS